MLAGDNLVIIPSVLMGASGAIAAAGHVCTPTMVQLVAAARWGDAAAAAVLAWAVQTVVTAGCREPNPAFWRVALHAAGEIPTPLVRSRMTTAAPGDPGADHERRVRGSGLPGGAAR